MTYCTDSKCEKKDSCWRYAKNHPEINGKTVWLMGTCNNYDMYWQFLKQGKEIEQ